MKSGTLIARVRHRTWRAKMVKEGFALHVYGPRTRCLKIRMLDRAANLDVLAAQEKKWRPPR